VILLCALALLISFLNSFRFNPDPSGDTSFIARAQQKSAPGIKVNVSALGANESLPPITMDPNYYSSYEVSYRFHGTPSFAANRARDEFFLKRQMANILPPHSRTTGFVYGVLDAGVKYAHIVLAGNNRVETFDFVLPVPGPPFVGTNIRADNIYPGKKIEDLELGSLRTTFAKQTCCTTNSGGTREGDPLNLVIVEAKQDPLVPFIARGWHLARQLDVASAIETARAFLFRDAFLTSPVSPLYVFGRREDLALQKARSTINERVHARLWLTPYALRGEGYGSDKSAETLVFASQIRRGT
jgi:LssY C-terminus